MVTLRSAGGLRASPSQKRITLSMSKMGRRAEYGFPAAVAPIDDILCQHLFQPLHIALLTGYKKAADEMHLCLS